MIELLELKFSRRWQTNKIESDWSNSPRHSSSRQFRSPSGHCNFGQKYHFNHVSRFNKSQGRNFSTINQSKSFLKEIRGLVTSVKSLVESHRAGGPTMAFQGHQTQQ